MNLLESVSIISPANESRGQIAHALDGRFQPLRPAELISAISELVLALEAIVPLPSERGGDEGRRR